MPQALAGRRCRSNARKMRRTMTDAELKRWNALRAHRLMGLGFCTQMLTAGNDDVLRDSDGVCQHIVVSAGLDGPGHNLEAAA